MEYVVDDRKQERMESYFCQFTEEEFSQIETVAIDMWEPYVSRKRHTGIHPGIPGFSVLTPLSYISAAFPGT